MQADGGGGGGAAGKGGGGGGQADEEWPRRVVSGLQPTGALHVGNYFGCVRHLVRAQERGDDLMVFIADLHALTTHQGGGGGDGASLGARSLELAAWLLAAGLEPARAVLWPQSAVARHSELAWALTCVASRARLEALPQYRERAQAGQADRMGALMYPVLQAADILLYRGTHVPVGADQAQHLQLAAALVKSFHHRYGRAFPTPRPLLPTDGSDRVRSLRAPDRKMSKSDADRRASLLLADADDDIRLKIRKAVTDCEPRVTWEPERRPGVANLVRLHCLAADLEPEEVVEEFAHLTTAQYKGVVADALVGALAPIRARAHELLARPAVLRAVLRDGAARARARADHTWECVARLLGLAAPALPAPPAAVLRQPPAAAAPAAPADGGRTVIGIDRATSAPALASSPRVEHCAGVSERTRCNRNN